MKPLDPHIHADSPFGLESVLGTLRSISRYSAAIQLFLLLLIMFSGLPWIYETERGLLYVSDHFCTKPALGTLFIMSTLPTWVILTCSLALEPVKWKRTGLIFIMAFPMSAGLGVILFSLCETHFLHYLFVNLFVASVGCIHLAITLTARHVEFLNTYYLLLGGTTVCSLSFVILAGVANVPGTTRNAAVISEYLAVTGFVILNSLAADRLREHVQE